MPCRCTDRRAPHPARTTARKTGGNHLRIVIVTEPGISPPSVPAKDRIYERYGLEVFAFCRSFAYPPVRNLATGYDRVGTCYLIWRCEERLVGRTRIEQVVPLLVCGWLVIGALVANNPHMSRTPNSHAIGDRLTNTPSARKTPDRECQTGLAASLELVGRAPWNQGCQLTRNVFPHWCVKPLRSKTMARLLLQ